MNEPTPETRNVIVEVYVNVPREATLRQIEDKIEFTINTFTSEEMHVTDIEAKENPLSE